MYLDACRTGAAVSASAAKFTDKLLTLTGNKLAHLVVHFRGIVIIGKKLLKQVGLFDVYRGDKIAEGKKQYALSFVLQDLDKTLTDNDVERVMSKLLSTFQNEFGAVLR